MLEIPYKTVNVFQNVYLRNAALYFREACRYIKVLIHTEVLQKIGKTPSVTRVLLEHRSMSVPLEIK